MRFSSAWPFGLAIVICAGACSAGQHQHASPKSAAPRDADHAAAEALVVSRCTACHSEAPIYDSVGTENDWHLLVHRMVYHHKGKLLSHISDVEATEIARYLADVCKVDGSGIRIGAVPTGRPL